MPFFHKIHRFLERFGIFKRKSLNPEINSIRSDFKTGIDDFSRFCELQDKKREMLISIRDVWKKNWKNANDFIKIDSPRLIEEQMSYLDKFIKKEHEIYYNLKLRLAESVDKEQADLLSMPTNKGINNLVWIISHNDTRLKEQNTIIWDIHLEYVKTIEELKELLSEERTVLLKENVWELIDKGATIELIGKQDKLISGMRQLNARLDESINVLVKDELMKRLFSCDSVEMIKLVILSDMNESYKNPMKRAMFIYCLGFIKELTRQTIISIRDIKPMQDSAQGQGVDGKDQEKLHSKLNDLASLLEEQIKSIDKIINNLERGNFYLKYFMLKETKIGLMDIPRRNSFNTCFFALMKFTTSEFGEYRRELINIIHKNIMVNNQISDIQQKGRYLPYWSYMKLSQEKNNLARSADENYPSNRDYITEEEVFFDDNELSRLPPERRKRIKVAMNKVNRLFREEMANMPISGNILFHSSQEGRIMNMVREGFISTKFEKFYVEKESIGGHMAGGSVGISFDFDVGAHFGFSWENNVGGIFMVPVTKTLSQGNILTTTKSHVDSFEIILLGKEVESTKENIEIINSMKMRLIDILVTFYKLKEFYEGPERFFREYVYTFDQFIALIITNTNGTYIILDEGQKKKISSLMATGKIQNKVHSYSFDGGYRFNSQFSIEEEINKESLIKLIKEDPTNSELKSIFEGLYEEYNKNLSILKAFSSTTFSQFLSFNKNLEPRRDYNHNMGFYIYLRYVEGLRIPYYMQKIISEYAPIKLDWGNAQTTSGVFNIESISEEPLRKTEFFDFDALKKLRHPQDMVHQLIYYIFSKEYESKRWVDLDVKEMEEIIVKKTPAMIAEIERKYLSHAQTKVPVKDVILMVPYSRFPQWEWYFKSIHTRPYLTFYFKDRNLQDHATDILYKFQDDVIHHFLEKCSVRFSPLFMTHKEYVSFFDGRYLEGTKFNLKGECLAYDLKSFSEERRL
ncbi:MAG: hypothetical protein NT001_04270, partial [Candidatus Woesearchaeota archaeon]|nr:hypothetical protein [Candidatus Woesearchaeota archaeon]